MKKLGQESSQGESHQPVSLAVIIATIIIFIFMILLNGMANMPHVFYGMFYNTTGEIFESYPLDITPASWTFTIWIVIYLYQFAIIFYILTSIYRRTGGKFANNGAPYLSPVFYFSYIFNNLANIAWLVLWDRRQLEYSFLSLALMALSLHLCLFVSIRGLFQAVQCRKWESKVVVGIVHNGLGLYAAWVTMASILNGTIVLIYRLNLSEDIASLIALHSLIGLTLKYFILDQIIFERYMRMLFTPYLVLLYAMIGIIFRHWDFWNTTTISCLSVTGYGMLLFITKIIRSFHENSKEAKLCQKPHVPHSFSRFLATTDQNSSDFLY